MGPPGHNYSTGDVINSAGKAPGIAECATVRRKTLDFHPVEGINFFSRRVMLAGESLMLRVPDMV